MAQIIKLQVGDNQMGRYTKEYLLTDYKCFTHRHHNEYRPEADKYCDKIELSVIAQGREDMRLYDWFISQSTINGRLLITLPPQSNQLAEETRIVEFEDAICFSLEEDFHIGQDQRRQLKLSMIADRVVIDGVVFNRNF